MRRFFISAAYLFLAPISELSADETESIEIIAQRPEYLASLENIVSFPPLNAGEQSQTDSMADFLANSPMINFNGQGGLFQTLSIRGLSRWRIQTLIEGIPIHTERRAGTAAEFIAPDMVTNAFILPGAASSQHGSGALGGSMDMQLQRPQDGLFASALGASQRFKSIHLQNDIASSSKTSSWQWAINARDADNSQDASGNLLQDRFSQYSGLLRYQNSDPAGIINHALVLYSHALDVGKTNAYLPSERITSYPSNTHWIAKVSLNWLNTEFYSHHMNVETEIERPGIRTNWLQNQALGWGVRLGESLPHGNWDWRWQLQLDARDGVTAREQERTTDNILSFSRTNLDGKQREWSALADASRSWRDIHVAWGARISYMKQTQEMGIRNSRSNTNTSFFAGIAKHWQSGLKLSAYFSDGYRVANLTERYFNGSTPRGNVLGDENLDNEHAKNFQIQTQYSSSSVNATVNLFGQRISNYIERITVNDDLRQYINIGQMDIRGIDYQLVWRPSNEWQSTWQGQWLSSDAENGDNVNDISPHQHLWRLDYLANTWNLWLEWHLRQRKTDPGSGEIELNGTGWINAGLSYEFNDITDLHINLRNASDRVYRVSADDIAPLARERDIQLRIVTRF